MEIKDYNSFYSLCNLQNQKIAKEVYERLPKKLKKKIQRRHVMICDYFYHSKYPDQRIPGMPIGFFNIGSRLIDLIPEETRRLSEDGLRGLIAHEVAHFHIESLSFFIKKIKRFIFLIRFKKMPIEWQKFYREPEELHADWVACKWGFEKDINSMNNERQIKHSDVQK